MTQAQRVFDESGVWITNQSQYPYVDWTNGCRFEPGIPTKAPETAFVLAHPTVLVVEKPPKVPKLLVPKK
jgi:hypothetical protein